jgi:PQQ-dependent dehydrogenase (methanol/ethanol family)
MSLPLMRSFRKARKTFSSIRGSCPALVACLVLALAGGAHAQGDKGLPAETPGEASSAILRPENIGTLQPVFSFRTGQPGRAASAPLVSGNRLFFVTPFPHTVYAIDLSAPGNPVAWQYRPEADGRAGGLAEGVREGGLTLAGDRLYLNTLDGRTVALEAGSGTVIWTARIADPGQGETLAAPPLVAGGRVILGNGGDRFGARGWIAALDAATGRLLWRRYSTGPDAEVGIGPGYRPIDPADAGGDRGINTWPPSAWQHGGGGVSGPILWDAASDLLFHGTGYPAPWNPEQRQGDNRWTSGLFAREAADGTARWFLPLNPHDLYALGGQAPNLLLEHPWQGSPRRLLVHPDANGHVYVLDRDSGEILSATPFLPVNATTGVDPRTGALSRNPAKAVKQSGTTRDICPGHPGAVTGASAFLPATGLLYIPARQLCMDMEARNANFMPGTGFTGANLRGRPAGDAPRGLLVGWDLKAARAAWTVPERFPLEGDTLATEGGLVLYGTLDGVLKALDARSGAELWRFQAGAAIMSPPLAFTGPDGRPWLAVLAGSGQPGEEIDMRDATAASGLANVLQDLPPPRDPAVTLHVFRLP